MVFGRAMTLRPSWERRFAVFVEPLPPSMKRQSSFRLLYVFFMAGTFCTPSASGVSRSLKGVRLVPRMVPPWVRTPEKSFHFILR